MKRISKLIPTALCICLFAAIALGSGSSDSDSSDATKVGNVTGAGDKGSSNGSTTNQTEFKVGETFSKDGLSITYVSSCDWESDNEFDKPAEGNKFIRLLFHVDNQSGSDQSVTVYSFNCYADGYQCEKEYEDDDLSASLSNGRAANGAVYFEVPVEAKVVEIEYEYNLFSGKKVKFIFEGNKDSGLTFEKNTTMSENAFRVGDIIETKELKISYLKAATYESDNMFLQPGEGMKYVYIELEVENLSDSDQSISSISFDCYADGTACEGFYGMDDELSATLSAGRKAKGTIAFEVPVDTTVIEFEFEDNIWTDKKIIFLYEE